MSVYPAFGVLLALWLVAVLRDPDNSLRVTVAALPMGMFAALAIGGLSALAAHVLAGLTLALGVLRWVGDRRRAGPVHLSGAGLFVVLFAAYAAFSATVLVRLFSGDFLIFPMSVSLAGTPVSTLFPSTMFPLAPNGSNLAQTLYIILSAGVFVLASATFARRGPQFGETAMIWAAGVNLVLGGLDLVQLDSLLAVIRTADYTLNNQHTMGGFARVIGGFAEASSFGAASAALAGYFAMSFLIGRRARDGMLALACLGGALASLSSSGLVALAAAGLAIAWHARSYLGAGMSRGFGHGLVICLAALAAGFSLALLSPAVSALAGDLVDRLILSKAASASGLERGAWAQAGFDAFVQTWGLGAGAGSLRANGLISVLLGNVGLPGAVLFLGFVWASIGPLAVPAGDEARRVFMAARVSALTLLSAMLIAGTTPDPTLHLVTVLAMAAAVRQGAPARAAQAPGPLAPTMPGPRA